MTQLQHITKTVTVRRDLWQPFTVIASLQQALEERGALAYDRERAQPTRDSVYPVFLLAEGSNTQPTAEVSFSSWGVDWVKLREWCYQEKLEYHGYHNVWEVRVYPMFMGVSHKAQKVVWYMDEPYTMTVNLVPNVGQ